MRAKSEQHRQLGEHMSAALKSRHMTQETLANLLGVQRQTVNQWVAGARWPQPIHRQRIFEVLGFDVPDEPTILPPQPAKRVPSTYGPGARYLAMRVTETLASVLREVTEAEDAAERAALLALDAKAKAAIPPATAPDARARGTSAPRRRQGRG